MAGSMLFIYILTLYIFVDRQETLIYSEIAFILFAAALLFYKLCYLKPIKLNYQSVCLLLFILWNIFIMPFAIDSEMAIVRIYTMLQILIMTILISNYVDNHEKPENVLKYLMYSGIIMCIYMVFVYGIQGIMAIARSSDQIRLGSEINQINTMGTLCSLTVVISFYFIIYRRKFEYILYAAIAFTFAMLSGSRKTVIIIGAGIFLLYALKSGREKIRYILLSLALLLVVWILISQLPIFHVIYERLDIINFITGQGKVDSSTVVRDEMIKGGWQAFLERPVLGYGLSNSAYINNYSTGRFTYLHNNYIELLVCTGMIGFIFYYAFYIISFIKLVKLRKNNPSPAVIIFLTLLAVITVSEIGMVSYYDKVFYIIFSAMSAFITSNKHIIPEKKKTFKYKNK